MLSSTALPSEIQIPTGKVLWNKVQSSYPAAVTGLSDIKLTECSQLQEKSSSCSLGPYPGHVDYSRQVLLVMVVNSILKCGLLVWSSVLCNEGHSHCVLTITCNSSIRKLGLILWTCGITMVH